MLYEVITVMLVKLGEAEVKTLDDLADLASDELIDIVGADEMTEDEANAVIMAARAHWFADEETDAAEPDDANSRITSYNVCYTKLLRVIQPHVYPKLRAGCGTGVGLGQFQEREMPGLTRITSYNVCYTKLLR